MTPHRLVPIAVLLAAAGCSSSSHSSACNTSDPNACDAGKVCEAVSGGATACFAPLVVKGVVTELASPTAAAVAGARVVAMDANRAPASAVGVADASGAFALAVPATRAADGTPAAASITLRADAQGYQTFPGGLRTALPVNLSSATYSSAEARWVVQGALTALQLVPLPSTADLLSISGKVAQPATRVGVLVVATPGATPSAGGRTAIADLDGSYTIFNLPASAGGVAYAVNAYGQGVNYAGGSATLTVGAAAPTVNLALANSQTAQIAASPGLIFNSGAAAPTSVALVVQSTYDAALDRGESPPGLVTQVAAGSNSYAFSGVPDGTYVALAAFGIDGDVRDQSGTGNTAPIVFTVAGGALQGAAAQFKLVGAVELTTIDGVAVPATGVPVTVTAASPAFVWAKAPSYSAAQTFRADVYDAFGTLLWTNTQAGTGGGPFSATYGGVTMTPGMYYQLRVTALDGSGNPLSQTEDLKGVFVYQP